MKYIVLDLEWNSPEQKQISKRTNCIAWRNHSDRSSYAQ